jgi:hypothetical protein
MATFTKQQLSGSSNGRAVKVAASSTPGTTIHTATSTANQFDEVHLWAVNSDTTARKLTIELGGTSSPDDLIEQTIPPESGLVYVVPGLPLDGGVVVKAFCASANLVMLHGYTNRIDQS